MYLGLPQVAAPAQGNPSALLAAAIRNLFQGGTPGIIFDPSDLSTIYQDNVGVTPGAVGSVVGLILDKSQGLVLGNELVTNGDFSNGATSWSVGINWSVSGGVATHITGTGGDLAQLGILTPNKWYKATFDSTVSASNAFYIYSSITGADAYDTVYATITSGAKSFIFKAPSTGDFRLRAALGTAIVIDNISVKELPGYHAYQSSAGSKPILIRRPITGRRNLLTYTEDLANAAWTKTNVTITSNATLSPDGTTTGVKIEATSTTTAIYEAFLAQVTGGHTCTIYVKKGTSAATGAVFLFRNATTATDLARITINYDTGVVTQTVGAGATSEDAGGGWWKINLPSAAGITSGDTLRVYPCFTGATAAAGDYAFIWHPQAESGTTPTAYQKVVSTYDVTESGVQSIYGLYFDGIDDFLVTPTIDFTGTDKMFVCVGVRKLSDAAQGMLVELSASIASNTGSFAIHAPADAAAANYRFDVAGDVLSGTGYRATTFTAPITNVLSCKMDIGGALRVNEVFPRINATVPTLAAAGSASAGVGNFGNHPLYIGRRAGTSLPFNGYLYGLVIAGLLPTDSQLAQTENYINAKTGAY